jgi:polyhydroxyalkanoate synthase
LDRYIDPDTWSTLTKVNDGSWWPEWTRWLAERSGPRGAPPSMGAPERGLPALWDAPGAYVLQK